MSTATTTPQACSLPAVLDAMAGDETSSFIFRRDGASVRVSHARCRADAGAVAAALRERGVGPGSRVAIHGSTGYEWVVADLSCVLTGALSVALYPSAPLARAVAVAAESGCRTVFTDRADAAEAFRSAGFDVLFLGSGGPAGIASVADLVAAHPGGRDEPAVPRRGPFTVVSTSGTLSEPKLFAVEAAPLLYTMDRFAEIYGIGRGDRLLLYLPLSHLPQRMMLYWGLRTGLDFVLSDPAHLAADGAEHQPTLHVTVPRVLEHIRWRVQAKLRGANAPAGAAAAAYRAIFGSAIRSVFVGSAPTDPALMTELLAAGVPVFEVYGTTELGMIALNTPVARRPGTVGKPIPWGDVRLDPESREVLVRTPTPFLHGRLVDGRVEPRQWDPDRYEPTADVGEIDADGFLRVLGRLRDFMVLPSGEKVFVTPIETALAEAVGAGLCQVTIRPDGKLGALIFFEPDAIPPDTEVDLAVRRVNRDLHPWERVKSYAVVGRMPTIEEGCLTETTKPRRHVIDEVHGRTARWRRPDAPSEHAN
ncbi:long-subunit acyl-CoA synthetase (AMP-forming) [Saccharothrix tamanrassetensis]|uniref:Long-subunit acyl-CoA synthetase (AMP-forming) n=1 Tax=Saccharothrix tamanrassetensis TaxID=1051531 RepID=A0A841CA85_9PSEU|nr:AMP-binding protein [Saccharothrix tamanrassetensis]MBB5953853.1 long-subunit acyl-CoA synthetase (AMP-forming) [Saccharothrix tamanrassetensis]